MRRFLTGTVALIVALAGTVLLAQRVTNPDDLDKPMKKIRLKAGAI